MVIRLASSKSFRSHSSTIPGLKTTFGMDGDHGILNDHE